ncbi:hypothetical protein Naga_100863g3, partial [Nannochloropsis gaditana]
MAARRRQCTGYVQSDGHMNLAMRWTTKQNLVSHVGICVVSYVTIVPLEAGGAKRAPGCCWHQDSHACSVCRALAKHNEGSHFLAYILLIIMGALYADHRCLDGRARDQVSPSSAPFILANINPMSPPALESRSPRLANIFSTSLTQPSPFSHSCPPSPRGRGPYVLRRVGGDAHGAAVLFGVGCLLGGMGTAIGQQAGPGEREESERARASPSCSGPICGRAGGPAGEETKREPEGGAGAHPKRAGGGW